MNKITAVVIESDGTAYSIELGTSIKELSEAIEAPEAVCVWHGDGICAFVDYDYCRYAPFEDINAVAMSIMWEPWDPDADAHDDETLNIHGSVLFCADITDDEEPESLTNEQVIDLLNKAEYYAAGRRN